MRHQRGTAEKGGREAERAGMMALAACSSVHLRATGTDGAGLNTMATGCCCLPPPAPSPRLPALRQVEKPDKGRVEFEPTIPLGLRGTPNFCAYCSQLPQPRSLSGLRPEVAQGWTKASPMLLPRASGAQNPAVPLARPLRQRLSPPLLRGSGHRLRQAHRRAPAARPPHFCFIYVGQVLACQPNPLPNCCPQQWSISC